MRSWSVDSRCSILQRFMRGWEGYILGRRRLACFAELLGIEQGLPARRYVKLVQSPTPADQVN
jgi:hypothetical protein